MGAWGQGVVGRGNTVVLFVMLSVVAVGAQEEEVCQEYMYLCTDAYVRVCVRADIYV